MTNFDQQLIQVKEYLNRSYTKELLQKEFLPLVKTFIAENGPLFKQLKVPQKLLQAITDLKYGTKDDIATAIALVMASKPLYQSFILQFTEDFLAVWCTLIYKGMVAHTWIERKYDIKLTVPLGPIDKRYAGGMAKQLKPEYNIFYRSSGYSHQFWDKEIIKLSLPTELRALLLPFHEIPESAQLKGIDNPDKTDYLFTEIELSIHTEMPRVITYWMSQQFAYTAKARPSIPALNKTNKNLQLREFFPTADKSKKHLRTQLIAGIFGWVNKRQTYHDTPSFIRNIIQQTYIRNAITAPWLLPDIHGMGHIENASITRNEPQIFKLLGALPSAKWVTWENIEKYVEYHVLDIRPIKEYLADDKLHYTAKEDEKFNEYYSETNISLDIYEDAISYPFIKGSFFLFAALGLCELAYDEVEVNNSEDGIFSSWDGLRYVRRTALGDYACGLVETYELKSVSQLNNFEFSEETLFISVQNDDPTILSLLAPYADKIGPGRFHTNSAIFLKGIRSQKELEARILLFRNIAGKDLPANWELFLKELSNNVNPLEAVVQVMVLKIPPHNQTLIKLFARDEELRSLVSKAENFQIIVPNTKLSALKKRLQALGYFLQ